MKILFASGTALLALLWTLFIAVSAALADWLAGQGGQLQGGMQALAEWPMPPWIGLWLDPALAEALREDLVVIGPDGPMEVLSYYMQNGRMVLEICHKGDE